MAMSGGSNTAGMPLSVSCESAAVFLSSAVNFFSEEISFSSASRPGKSASTFSAYPSMKLK